MADEGELRKAKATAALEPYTGGWDNPLQEAIERIAYHALHFDARDFAAFRYIVCLARQVPPVRYRNWLTSWKEQGHTLADFAPVCRQCDMTVETFRDTLPSPTCTGEK